MTPLREALHRCAEILADALEAEGAMPLPARPKKSRTYIPPATPRVPQVDDVTRARATAALKKTGLGK